MLSDQLGHSRDAARLSALVSDFYWEQDGDGRFTRLRGSIPGRGQQALCGWHGRTPEDIGLTTETGAVWQAADACCDRDGAFRDRVVSGTLDDGAVRYFSLSGEAVVDPSGRACGYRGFGTDVTEEKLQQRELMQFRAAMDASRDMIFIVDRDAMRFVYANEMAARLVGYDREALLDVPPHELLLTDRALLEREYDEVIRVGGVSVETRGRTRDGSISVVEGHRRALYSGGRWLIVSIVHDISARKRAEWGRDRLARMYAVLSATNEAILRAATPDELYQQVCDAAVAGGGLLLASVLLVDGNSSSLSVRASAGMSTAYVGRQNISIDPSRPEGVGLVGECFRSRKPSFSNDYGNDERTRYWHAEAEKAGIKSAAAVPLLKGGECMGALLFSATERQVVDDDGLKLLERLGENVVFALENFEHEAQRKRGLRHIQYLATHDSLTGLPNRSLFQQFQTMAVAAADRDAQRFALLFIDLDRFKMVNDSLGHDAGDTLLRAAAERLQRCLHGDDVVARIGGDEFLVLLHDIDSRLAVTRTARAMLAAVLEPVEIHGQVYRVTCSIGIALYPDDADDASTLTSNADMAMYQAKEQGRNNACFYVPSMKARTLERMQLETHLRRAIECDEFTLAYQARISLATDEITGVEALLRWHSAELGELTPNQFLPVAEQTGLIIPIGRWVLATACAQNVAWQRQGLGPLRIAVNLSPVQFADTYLFAHVKETLRDTGMSPDLLELEITESAVMPDIKRAVDILSRIKRLGVHVAIDNFGTGYSSLAQLRQLPIDSLKIDRSFIRELANDTTDQATANAIIAMARSLSLNVVAEGVETAQQQTYLRSHACDDVQGFYFSRPDHHAAFAEWLRDRVHGDGAVQPSQAGN